MRYAVIATYESGEATGAIISAAGKREAWAKALELFNGGFRLRGLQVSAALTEERGGTFEEEKN